MTPRHAFLTILLAVALCGCARAQLLNFDFSFTGTEYPLADQETVTGEIFGLQNNATSAPTDVIVDAPYLPGPVNLSGAGVGGFTVTNGQVTAVTFQDGQDVDNGSEYDLLLNGHESEQIPLTAFDFESFGVGGETYEGVENELGFQAITFTVAPVPEPATWALLCSSGVACSILLARKRRA